MKAFQNLIELIREFNAERDWEKFHSPKNLAISISIEAAELLENFQWENKSANEIKRDKKQLQKISEELADIFIYSLNLIDKLGINIEHSIKRKLEINRKKYPLKKAKGSSKKYNEL